MSFSQSLLLGENTLNQLDVYEVNIQCVDDKNGSKSNKLITPTRSRTQKPLNGLSFTNTSVNLSPSLDALNSNKVLDVVDESPTEKTNVLGKSIRERLKNASTSKKSDRKCMRRSRSDPITTSDSKISKSTLYKNHGFTEEFSSMFDSTMELDETDERANRKTKIKLDERFEEDDFDMYVDDIQTPTCMQHEANNRNDTKDSSLIALSDSGGSEHVNVSEVERLMQAEHFETVDPSLIRVENDEQNDGIEWEDSAFFNDMLPSQQNTINAEQNDDTLPDVVIDVECVSMQSKQIDINDDETAEDELASCFLENSIHLSNLNATETKSNNKNGAQLDTSLFSRSISEAMISNQITEETENTKNLSVVQSNRLSIENLGEWGCSAAIIKAYKKKGINEMFEWQAECLSNPKVIAIEIIFIPFINTILLFWL